MKIEILDSAEEDLIDGFKFYENHSRGLGDYFLDSIFSDIESLRVYAGIHALHFGSPLTFKKVSFCYLLLSAQ